jgi:hypothetical protein
VSASRHRRRLEELQCFCVSGPTARADGAPIATDTPVRSHALSVLLTVGFLVGAVLSAAVAPAPAATFPAVDVVVVAEVYDMANWLALHQEVLATPAGSAKVLRVTLPARTGGSRTIDIEQPRITVGLVATNGKAQVKVTASGKIPPSMALALVTPFQHAAMEIQAGVVSNEVGLAYGLSTVVGRLLELYFDRP